MIAVVYRNKDEAIRSEVSRYLCTNSQSDQREAQQLQGILPRRVARIGTYPFLGGSAFINETCRLLRYTAQDCTRLYDQHNNASPVG
jgi:hypothetical protein